MDYIAEDLWKKKKKNVVIWVRRQKLQSKTAQLAHASTGTLSKVTSACRSMTGTSANRVGHCVQNCACNCALARYVRKRSHFSTGD